MVCPGVYRSGYPTRKNYRFIRALKLRTIIYLCPEEYAEANVKFCEENRIKICRFATEGNKEPFMDISETLMHRILTALIDTRLHPVLIHCNKGKHRTGTVAACLRLLQGWSLVSIFQEYRSFAGDKVRMGDMQYVELYRPIVHVSPQYVADWVCITPIVTVVHTQEELLEAEARQLGWSLLAPPPLELTSSKKGKEKVTLSEELVVEATQAEAVGGPQEEDAPVTRFNAASPNVRSKSSLTSAAPRRGGANSEGIASSTARAKECSGPAKREAEENRKGAK
uniref:diphosphoinositol-polyphosphate diphosphatase n=1 Tax=Trypanosoma congolense (strain IL3000) TaxID=1068625 RepID=G0UU05_TRYCI|nr:unnamed protein product [Trypanosoma congolense IL3000]